MTQEEVEKTFAGLSPYFAYKQGLQDGVAYTWDSFRREAAKDVLCSLLGRVERITTCVKRNETRVTDHRDFIRIAIEDADELIKQLKED